MARMLTVSLTAVFLQAACEKAAEEDRAFRLVEVNAKAFERLAVGGGTIEGEAGGTITVGFVRCLDPDGGGYNCGHFTLEDFTQDGQLVLNGELTFNGSFHPAPLKGDLVISGEAYEAPVDINVDATFDLSANPSGTVTVGGVEYDIGCVVDYIYGVTTYNHDTGFFETVYPEECLPPAVAAAIRADRLCWSRGHPLGCWSTVVRSASWGLVKRERGAAAKEPSERGLPVEFDGQTP